MIKDRYKIAMAETLHYLKGINSKDINKIPQKFMDFLEENASKEYICDFDYTKPIKELELKEETKGLIGVICLNYWCDTEEKREKFVKKLNENEQKYQEELREKYNPNNLFKNINEPERNQQDITADNKEETKVEELQMVKYKKESLFKRIIAKIKKFFSK